VTVRAYHFTLLDFSQQLSNRTSANHIADVCQLSISIQMIEIHDPWWVRQTAVRTWNRLQLIYYLTCLLPVSLLINVASCVVLLSMRFVVSFRVGSRTGNAVCLYFPGVSDMMQTGFTATGTLFFNNN
jgi:hypothetical protein